MDILRSSTALTVNRASKPLNIAGKKKMKEDYIDPIYILFQILDRGSSGTTLVPIYYLHDAIILSN